MQDAVKNAYIIVSCSGPPHAAGLCPVRRPQKCSCHSRQLVRPLPHYEFLKYQSTSKAHAELPHILMVYRLKLKLKLMM